MPNNERPLPTIAQRREKAITAREFIKELSPDSIGEIISASRLVNLEGPDILNKPIELAPKIKEATSNFRGPAVVSKLDTLIDNWDPEKARNKLAEIQDAVERGVYGEKGAEILENARQYVLSLEPEVVTAPAGESDVTTPLDAEIEIPMPPVIEPEVLVEPQIPAPKRRGRPPGSKNKVRRGEPVEETPMYEFSVDVFQATVSIGDEIFKFRKNTIGWEVMLALAKRKRGSLSAAQVARIARDTDGSMSNPSIHINNLKSKIGKDTIRTVRDADGYASWRLNGKAELLDTPEQMGNMMAATQPIILDETEQDQREEVDEIQKEQSETVEELVATDVTELRANVSTDIPLEESLKVAQPEQTLLESDPAAVARIEEIMRFFERKHIGNNPIRIGHIPRFKGVTIKAEHILRAGRNGLISLPAERRADRGRIIPAVSMEQLAVLFYWRINAPSMTSAQAAELSSIIDSVKPNTQPQGFSAK